MKRPANVTLALAMTLALAFATVLFRAYLAAELWPRHDGEAFAALAALEGSCLGVLPIAIALLCFAPRPIPWALLRVVYVLWILDALAWALLTPGAGLLIAVFTSAHGHGGSDARAAGFLASAFARWTWVVIKIALSATLLAVAHRQGGAWVRAARASR